MKVSNHSILTKIYSYEGTDFFIVLELFPYPYLFLFQNSLLPLVEIMELAHLERVYLVFFLFKDDKAIFQNDKCKVFFQERHIK